ncbi:Rha family transcriptional regulator [Paenibacillus anseongense]|uniref:Rha family transcriptional regulator n=1 Tax=Paenibacillus anseongense TaxID=2682845 RepID=UPI002DB9C6E6|nr:Rha family transcriptional regulator [Paenibacillus anseongense]MEC0265154.1 Rha family transcriptional regulator [Paenibacillus anseongense]
MSNVLTRFEQEFGLTVNEEGKIVTNSLKVADYYHKEHSVVTRKIKQFIELIPQLGLNNFVESYYINEQGKRQPMYIMDRQGFSMLVNKFTGDEATLFTYKYTKAFEEMAEEISDKRQLVQALTDKVKINSVLTLDDINAERFSTGRTIKTFANADMKVINELVTDFNEYVASMDTTTRMKRCKSAIDGIQRLHDRLAEDGVHNIGHCYNLKQLIIEIQSYRHKIENKRNGGHKSALTKKTNQLLERVKELDPNYISEGTCGIYSIINLVDGRKYIGSSKDISKRLYKHTYDLNMNQHHNDRLQAAWNTYSEESFKFKVIEECELGDLEEREDYWISQESTTDEEYGYNIYGRNV